MFKFAKDRISVITVLDKRRPKANGLYAVKVQVVYRRVQRYYLTGKLNRPHSSISHKITSSIHTQGVMYIIYSYYFRHNKSKIL